MFFPGKVDLYPVAVSKAAFVHFMVGEWQNFMKLRRKQFKQTVFGISAQQKELSNSFQGTSEATRKKQAEVLVDPELHKPFAPSWWRMCQRIYWLGMGSKRGRNCNPMKSYDDALSSRSCIDNGVVCFGCRSVNFSCPNTRKRRSQHCSQQELRSAKQLFEYFEKQFGEGTGTPRGSKEVGKVALYIGLYRHINAIPTKPGSYHLTKEPPK